ncbi:MAG: DUF1553 domain-containing protein [Planctomycetaceae bacterium]|nr:DUF1553 domain-containing protein [Planctomycetaceae bacterium]MBT6485834.1 DUF1553 domain-containing protein [Planctomycetaceae bacterium]MBT6493503.1 DUF1553 domain-containing protein [Planctomycetaceae bacterium]
MKSRASICAALAAVVVAVGYVAFAADEPATKIKPVDYTTQIKPLLVKHCYECHAAKKPQSGFRLDTAKLASMGGDRGAAIVPGKSEKSLLYLSLLNDDDVDVTQMPFELEPLKPQEISLIKRWIDEGAKAPKDEVAADADAKSDHWAFQPVVRPTLPTVKNAAWSNQPLDRFVLARLEKEGLAPSAEADRATLIRRLSLDLRGLPPSLSEVEQFLADDQPGAYERLVDRMLASPHYGERWGRHWLDLARYADSNGFTIDGPRSIWQYRDWVIDAVNDGKPFDKFTIEQIAGDLLPAARRDQLVATGFHRNTLINQEGGTDPEQFRVDAVVDRLETTGSVFLGLTIGCARCHEHKFDPISQREFYEMYAFLNGTQDVKSIQPIIPLPTPAQETRQKQLRADIASTGKILKTHDAKIAVGQAKWETEIATVVAPKWVMLDAIEFKSKANATINEFDDRSLIVGGNGNIPANDTYTVTVDVPVEKVVAVRLEVLTNSGLPKNGPGLADNGNFVLTEFSATVTAMQASGAATEPLKFSKTAADWSQDGFPAAHAIDDNAQTGWAINVAKGQGSANVDREAIFVLQQPLEKAVGTKLTFSLKHESKSAKYLIGRFRLSVTSELSAGHVVPAGVAASVVVPTGKRTPGQKAVLKASYSGTDETRQPLVKKLNALKKSERELTQIIPTTMIMREVKKPRESFVMIRGDFLRKGAVVQPKIPALFPQLPKDVENPGRLDLARWLVSKENPLTPRVTVNRYWQMFFGTGLVETENDFGTQGTAPSHPLLLDWLASEFVASGWDSKGLHRRIVTSATYRQSSRVSPELQEKDSGNRLLARQSRIRLEAEAIRDVCLSSSGLLSQKLGGPGVYPPQPTGINLLTQVSKAWPESKGDDRYRRGMYVYFWRSNPYPFLPTFDAPRANNTCTRRARSNTPLQALTLANDHSFFELAQGLATRILTDGPDDDSGRLLYAFRVCLSREPSEQEFAVLTQFIAQQRKRFESAEKDATQVAPAIRPEGISAAEAAAWTAAARVFLNLDEFITRE